jgi:cytochrome P450
MTTSGRAEIYYDPYDPEIYADPYPVFRRLREEAPLYYNEPHDFYALSRFDDVRRGFGDRHRLISSRGSVLEAIKQKVEAPPGFFIFDDPPRHTMYRALLSRAFTPKKMSVLEAQMRHFCSEVLDPLLGSERIDFVRDLGEHLPMRAIGMLLGIPDEHQPEVRDLAEGRIRTEPGQPRDFLSTMTSGDSFAEFIDWRVEHPSDDLMTDLLYAKFEDETGTVRSSTRPEIFTIVQMTAGAGNETTNRLIGWTGKLLSDYPDQRRAVAADMSLVPNTIEEILRYEPPALQNARYVAQDVEYHDETIPAGSIIVLLQGSANRDHRHFPDGDSFNIHRMIGQHLTFAYGAHFCIGASLARLEGRVALEEILKRFTDWEVDLEHAKFATSSTVRGWDSLPAALGRGC